jgi:hypothetical protein
MWLRRIRGAIGMGITWAIGWAIAGVALAAAWSIGAPLDGFFRVFDAPAPAMGLPGFFAGATFSLVLAIAARHRKFEELSLLRFTLLGALGGLLLVLPFLFLIEDSRAAEIGVWTVKLILTTPIVLLSAISAFVTLSIARAAERQAADGSGGGALSGAARPSLRDGDTPAAARPRGQDEGVPRSDRSSRS